MPDPPFERELADAVRAAADRDRAELVGGDFFVDVPAADVYVMKSILHDWDDEECVRILRVIQARAGAEARLLVVERVLGGPNEDLDGKLSDIHMLVMPGGLERTLDEWRSLLLAGGWALQRTQRLAAGWDLIEATRVAD